MRPDIGQMIQNGRRRAQVVLFLRPRDYKAPGNGRDSIWSSSFGLHRKAHTLRAEHQGLCVKVSVQEDPRGTPPPLQASKALLFPGDSLR